MAMSHQRIAQNAEALKRNLEYGTELIAWLDQQKVEYAYVGPGEHNVWNIRIHLPRDLRQVFGVEREVLVVATKFENVQPRLLNHVADGLKPPSVESDMCILVGNNLNPDQWADEEKGLGFNLIPVNRSELLSGTAPDMAAVLAGHLARVDHFAFVRPLNNKAAFFGRSQDIQRIKALLTQGQHVGVFGLKKAGKSSLVNRIALELREAGWSIIQIDLQREGTAADNLRRLLLQRTLDEADRARFAGSRIAGSQAVDAVSQSRNLWVDQLDYALALHRNAEGVLIVIDEIDLLLPGRTFEAATTSEAQLATIGVLQQLRGLTDDLHNNPARKSPVLLTAGTDADLFGSSFIDERPNPLWAMVDFHYLGPLDLAETSDMVRTLGRRSGLNFTEGSVIHQLFDDYGGHPLVTRTACSSIHRRVKAEQVPYSVSTQDVVRVAKRPGPKTAPQLARDIPQQFMALFPDEATLLRPLLEGGSELINPDDAPYAVEYGVLTEDGRLRLGILRRD
ncbi:ATP-binding protein [Micromonospora wenchangensis]|uniref:ATP-binding protein n=1 Tax=Micromonospora wenchangensis TaxID=1185415 RepID=UPI0033D4BBB8